MKKLSLLLLFLCVLVSCSNYKDIPYFQNSDEFDGSTGAMLYDITIKPKDMLTIFVNSTDDDAVAQFNIRDPRPIDEASDQVRVRRGTTGQVHQYLVDNNGEVEFPVLGHIQLSGLTVEQAADLIKTKIAPYLNAQTDCLVNVRIDNFEVSVMGEVNYPNTFSVTRNRLTILEALAMAGDMTIYGKRDNVKLLRELPNGEYEIHKLDLRDANVINSPYYYMQQRDVLYVEPNEVMAQNAKIGRTRQLWIRGASITIALGSLLYRVLSD